MGEVVHIHSRRKFNYEEALKLLPVIRRITERAAAQAKELQERIGWTPADEPLHKRLKARLSLVMRRWSIKISQLGCEPRGMWLVDFDAGNGWFSWRYGDDGLNFFHSHQADRSGSAIDEADEIPT